MVARGVQTLKYLNKSASDQPSMAQIKNLKKPSWSKLQECAEVRPYPRSDSNTPRSDVEPSTIEWNGHWQAPGFSHAVIVMFQKSRLPSLTFIDLYPRCARVPKSILGCLLCLSPPPPPPRINVAASANCRLINNHHRLHSGALFFFLFWL